MTTSLESIQLDVVKVQINGKKLTSTMLAQLPFIDFHQHIEEFVNLDQYPEDLDYIVACRVSKMACVKHYKEKVKLQSHPHDSREWIDGRVNKFFEDVDSMVIWETPHGELALHRLYKGAYIVPKKVSEAFDEDLQNEWSEAISAFAIEASAKPLAIVGV